VGRELYVSDGTPAGTALFVDVWPGTTASQASSLVSCDPLLFFRAAAQNAGTELWVTDGTAAGTRMLPEIVPGLGSPQISDMVGVSGRLFFAADDLVHGRELWTSDGTAAGTRMVADLMPGLGHGVQIGSMIRIPGTRLIAFVGSDGIDGLQLWLSDGTTAGTTRMGRMGLLPGSGASVARNLGVAGERLFFVGGNEGPSGDELWAIQLGNLGAAFAVAYGDGQCPGTGGLKPRIGAFGLPRLGNATFAIDVLDARPSAPAAVQLGLGQTDLPIDACRFLVLPLLISLPPITTDAVGIGRRLLPIPGDMALAGLRLTAQWAIIDPNGALFGSLTLSDGLLMQLGQ
jgi:ELWxxDGT repeat protein